MQVSMRLLVVHYQTKYVIVRLMHTTLKFRWSPSACMWFIPDIVIVNAIEWPCEKMDTKIQAKTQLHMIAIFLSTVLLF